MTRPGAQSEWWDTSADMILAIPTKSNTSHEGHVRIR
jgi:hypothetical protein